MAARAKTTTSKVHSASARRKMAAKDTSVKSGELTLAQMQEQYQQLQDRLETSEARVAELEVLLEDAINRIEWALELLHNATPDA